MSKYSILFSVMIVTLLLAQYACNTKIERDVKNEYPGEWMYNQRAYPNNYINKKAISDAIEQTKVAYSKKNSRAISWNLLGPINIGGRVTDVAISPDNDNHFFISTAVGGVFKTIDKGLHWIPIFDNIGRPSIGNIEIAPSDANRIYVGTGEANGSATSGANFGDGIYRSDDAGDTWTHIGLEDTQYIGRIVVDPNDKNRVFAATAGVLYGKNEERGLYRTLDGGNNWEKVLYVSDSTAVIDVVLNPLNTNVLFAATWERIRYPWQRSYGGVTSGVHRSLDGGNTWVNLTNGLPVSDSETGRIGLAISKSNPTTIYASYTTNAITNVFDGLYKSTDNGDSWVQIAYADISDVNSSFGWYFGNLRVHPTNPNEVYVLGQQLYKTTNAGVSWIGIYDMHVDHHAMEYSINNPDILLMGNDGGVYLSENGGSSWSHFENLPITQFYNIEIDNLQPQRRFGGAQDNNTLRTTTGLNDDWSSILGGDGFQVNVDKNDSNYVYAEYQWGNLSKSTDGGNTMYWATDGIDYDDRKNWNTPVEISPFNTNVLYYGSQKLYRSTNRADTWSAISGDLTGGEHPSGSTSYGTLTCIAPSYMNQNVIYTGSDDGKVNVTFDGGGNWQAIDTDLPNRFVSQIAIHPNNDLVAYVTFSGYTNLDYTPHIYKTIDGGANWQDISGNLPSIPINDVVIYADYNQLYIATDTGVWYSANDGISWDIVGDNLQIGIVSDIKIHEDAKRLYAGTFGRSMYYYDLDILISDVNDVQFNNHNIQVYPNPIKDQFTLEITLKEDSNIVILLSSINGKKISKIFDGKVLKGKQKIDLNNNNLSKGIYFLRIKTKDKQIVKKIIIE
jgi:photosystem II stability/assembly factor-like uncharacterized protein